MKKLILCTTMLIGGCLLHAQEKHRLKIQPLDIQDGAFKAYLRSIDQLETDGTQIYLRCRKEPRIVVIAEDGTPIRQISGSGEGPGRLGNNGPVAMAVHGQTVVILDYLNNKILRFQDGAYTNSFPFKSYQKVFTSPAVNNFTFTDTALLIPNAPDAKGLADRYDHQGRHLGQVGEMIRFPKDLTDKVGSMNDSQWVRDDKYIYCLRTFQPLITTYTLDLKKVSETEIKSRVAQAVWRQVQEFVPEPGRPGIPFPVLTDAQAFQGKLYAMIGGAIHEIDPRSGEVANLAFFYGEGPDFASVETPTVSLMAFRILDNGKVILAHPALLWNHDLWTVKLPFLNPRS